MGWWPVAEYEATIDQNVSSRNGEGFVVCGNDGTAEHIYIISGKWIYSAQADAEIVRQSVQSKRMLVDVRRLRDLCSSLK